MFDWLERKQERVRLGRGATLTTEMGTLTLFMHGIWIQKGNRNRNLLNHGLFEPHILWPVSVMAMRFQLSVGT